MHNFVMDGQRDERKHHHLPIPSRIIIIVIIIIRRKSGGRINQVFHFTKIMNTWFIIARALPHTTGSLLILSCAEMEIEWRE